MRTAVAAVLLALLAGCGSDAGTSAVAAPSPDAYPGCGGSDEREAFVYDMGWPGTARSAIEAAEDYDAANPDWTLGDPTWRVSRTDGSRTVVTSGDTELTVLGPSDDGFYAVEGGARCPR